MERIKRLALLAVFAAALCGCEQKLTYHRFETISQGDSPQVVEATLGKPWMKGINDQAWVYQDIDRGINAIIYYSSKIFESAGAVKDAAFTSSAWVGLINLLFTFVAIAFVDKAGRKPLLLAGTAVQTVALVLIGWMFHIQQGGLILLVFVVSFTGAFAAAMGPIPWILCSEIFPNKIRGRAMSVATFTIWFSCYIVALTFPMLNDNPAIGPALTFWTYGLVSLFTFAFVWAMVPETKGRTLEEIEKSWRAEAGE